MNHIISWVLLIIPTFCYAQSMRNFDYLDSASVEYCRGETRMVNYYLEQFIQKFPEDALIEEVMLRLGESYLEIKDFQPAKTKLVSVLNLKERDRKFDQDGALYHSNFDQMFPIYDSCFYSRCLQIVKSNYLRNIKYRACKDLSELHVNQQQYDSSLYYLALSEKAYLPAYGGCVNGMLMEMALITNEMTEVYLLKRDTFSAINRLMSAVFYYEGNNSRKAHRTLRTLLQTRYSAAEIKNEMDRAIANSKIITEESKPKPYFSFFEYKPKVLAWSPYNETDESLRKWLRENPYLQELTK